MNKVILQGRLANDIDLRATQTGKSVASFCLAVNRDYKNTEGEYDADFINCVVWDKSAETLAKYVKKGDRLLVSGKLMVRKYEKDGNSRYITEVILDGFDLIAEKKQENTPLQGTIEPVEAEDIPF